MEYNIPEIPKKMEEIAGALGQRSAREGAHRVRELMGNVGAPLRLGDIGVKESDLDLIIKEGFTRRNNPRPISPEKLRALLKAIL